VQFSISEARLNLMDFSGRIVYTKTTSVACEIQVADLPAGMYLLLLETSDGKTSAKRIIKN
jgi:hypothetical protein